MIWLAVESKRGFFAGQGDHAYHEQRSHDPVHDNAESYLYPDLSLAEHAVQGLELDFAQDWVHHHEQANGCFQLVKAVGRYLGLLTDRNRNLDEFTLL